MPLSNLDKIKNTSTTNSTNTPNQPSDEKKKVAFLDWSKNNSEILMMILGVLTLVAFILVSIDQGRKTREAIKRADTANFYTKQSIDLAKQDGISSDILNRKAIDIADSSLKVSEKISNIQKDATIKELRAYHNQSKYN